MHSTPAQVDRVIDLLRYSVSRSRFEHSRRVARCAKDIGEAYGLMTDRCLLAGWGHDLAREWSAEALLDYARHEPAPEIDPAEEANPVLLHGRAAARILAGELGVADGEVLEAVRNHTLGKPGFCAVGKCLYCADYLEPDRPAVPDSLRNQIGRVSLDELVEMVVTDTRRRGYSIAARTEEMYQELTSERGTS